MEIAFYICKCLSRSSFTSLSIFDLVWEHDISLTISLSSRFSRFQHHYFIIIIKLSQFYRKDGSATSISLLIPPKWWSMSHRQFHYWVISLKLLIWKLKLLLFYWYFYIFNVPFQVNGHERAFNICEYFSSHLLEYVIF